MKILAIATLALAILIHGLLGKLSHDRREQNIKNYLRERVVVPPHVVP